MIETFAPSTRCEYRPDDGSGLLEPRFFLRTIQAHYWLVLADATDFADRFYVASGGLTHNTRWDTPSGNPPASLPSTSTVNPTSPPGEPSPLASSRKSAPHH